jgi:S1-C subfamily serine protease
MPHGGRSGGLASSASATTGWNKCPQGRAARRIRQFRLANFRLRRPPLATVAAVTAMTVVSTSASCQQSSVLKQLQQEVSSVIAEGRRAVVTVEETPMMTVVLSMQYQEATKVATGLRKALAGRASVAADPRTNSLTFSGDASVVPTIKFVVGKHDRPGAAPSGDVFTRELVLGTKLIAPNQQGGDHFRAGSGFSIGEGYVLTSADVLQGMKNPTVVTDSGVRLQARAVGIDLELNVGLLRLTAPFTEVTEWLGELKLGISESVRPGHFGTSIGNQSGSDNTSALMIVGGVRTEGTYGGRHFYPSLIQIAGTVGAGSSGAPLLNVDGHVIGILIGVPADNVAYYQSLPVTGRPARTTGQGRVRSTPRKSSVNKIPLRTAAISRPMKKDGTAEKPVPNQTLGKPLNSNAGTAGLTEPQAATLPLDLARTGPSAGAFLTPGTLITDVTFSQPNVVNPPYFSQASGAKPIDQWAFIRPPVTSSGFAIPIDVLKPVIESLRSGRPIVRAWFGMDLQDEQIPVEKNGIVRMDSTVRVGGVYRGSPADRAGLQLGDIVLSINGKRTHSGADVRAVLMSIWPEGTAAIDATRGGKVIHLKVRLEPRPPEITSELITGRPVEKSP